MSMGDDEYEEDSGTARMDDPLHSTSHQEGEDGASGREQAQLEVEQAKQLIKIFHTQTLHIVSDGLMGEQSPEDIASEYVAQIKAYYAEMRASGWANHQVIKTSGFLQYNPTVEAKAQSTPAHAQLKRVPPLQTAETGYQPWQGSI